MTTVSSQEQQLNVPYLPLSKDEDTAAGGQSIGKLVSDATQHVSTLVRAEVELAKTEVVREAKKAVKGAVFFIIALAVLLYSSFFFFFFLGELLSEWLQRWAAYGIVFLLMLVVAGLFGWLGYLKVRKIRAPERTLASVKETAAALKPQHAEDEPAA
ncbi:phage holin family protein [Amycolatopsis sp. cg5]|uniref:phage holin family protein n=1 Tax=Amycolatopsis sp. cg5 TaxID=3238802 RepID=UPI003524880B